MRGKATYSTDPFPIALQDSSLGVCPIDGCGQHQHSHSSKLQEGRDSHWRVRCARYVGLITMVLVIDAKAVQSRIASRELSATLDHVHVTAPPKLPG
jgi:hypothetical protein